MAEEAEVDPVENIEDEAPVEEEGEPEVASDENEGDDGEAEGEEGEDEEDDDDDEDEDDEDEEDPIDPYETAREKCAESKQCADLMSLFNECETRVQSKSQTEENCSQEILDFFHCQDTCAAKGLFAKLK